MKGNIRAALRALHVMGRLPDPILDTIVHESASYRAVHYEPRTVYEVTERELGLSRAAINGDPEALQTFLSTMKARIANLGASVARLEGVIAAKDLALANANNELAVRRLREKTHPLFQRHGINMDAPDDNILFLVSRLRRWYAQQYHTQDGRTPDEERLKNLNSELDTILRLRGLKPNDEAPGSPDVDQ